MKTANCGLCHHNCQLQPGQVGRCGVREGDGAGVKSLVYGKLVAENVDPVEKKPVFHVLPGSLTYSIATPGCNFSCSHCQNSSISQLEGDVAQWQKRGRALSNRLPEEVVEKAIKRGCTSLSYTYVEPTIFFEYAYDCAKLAHQKGLGNIFVSNGYMSGETLESLAPFLTAINIDLKSWSDTFYRKVCGAKVAPVLENIRRCVALGLWVEVTTLVIPGMNDSVEELQKIAAFLSALDAEIPWHVTAFYPAYKMGHLPPTPVASIERAVRIGKDAGLNYVYSGNVSGQDNASSFCHHCGENLIGRSHFTLLYNSLIDGCCPSCNTPMPGIWSLGGCPRMSFRPNSSLF